VDVVAPTVETLLRESSEELSDDQFEAMADHLADELARHLSPGRVPLSDEAVSREGIYEGHA
jgi:antitoxin ParD1/3/4